VSSPIEWRRGRFKNLSLRVLPDGRVRVTSPWYLPRFLVDRFVAERSDWIEGRRQALVLPEPDLVMVWGERHTLRVISPGRLPRVLSDPAAKEVILRVPASWTPSQRQTTLDRWEKERVHTALQELLPAWSSRTGLTVARWTVKRLRSRWGSCRPETQSLVFNSRLGAFPRVCLEYVVVHELAHLIEPSHNARFHAIVEGWLPGSSQARLLLRKG